MASIEEINQPSEVNITCAKEKHEVSTSHYWKIDGEIFCDKCYVDGEYDTYEQCIECGEYEHPDELKDGLCDYCFAESQEKVDPMDRAGWDDNIQRMNEGNYT